ncbi:MAG: hypothetical protein GY796_35430 [Chloroflexi bacterium]|nr:hypothetical protein [Chloroflexota bacterium]
MFDDVHGRLRHGRQETILQNYWDALDADNRVALAVKVIDNGRSRLFIQNRV